MVKKLKRRRFDKLGKITAYQPKGSGWFEYEPIYKGYHDRKGVFHDQPISQTEAEEKFYGRESPEEKAKRIEDAWFKKQDEMNKEAVLMMSKPQLFDDGKLSDSIVGKRMAERFKTSKKWLPKKGD